MELVFFFFKGCPDSIVQVFLFVYLPIARTNTDISTKKVTIRLQMHRI